jgi:UDP-glucose 4-epimerase
MKERVLITGASGFVGHHIVEEALKNNLDVFAAIRKTSKIDHLENFPIRYTSPDFSDVNSIKNDLIENNYTYIIHCAGLTKARKDDEYNQVNGSYIQNIAQAITESGLNIKKLILISSLAAVGPLDNLSDSISENTPANPLTAYGKSKLLGETLLKSFPSINYTILRPTAVYGPRDKDILIFFKQLNSGIEPYIGRADQKLSFIYVTDLAKASIKALYADYQTTYNISDGYCYNRYELAQIAKEILHQKTIKIILPLTLVKTIAKISTAYGSLKNKAVVLNVEKIKDLVAINWCLSIDRAKTELAFYPEHDLKAGVTASLSWYKLNGWL